MPTRSPHRPLRPPRPSVRRTLDPETRAEILETEMELDRVLARHIAKHVSVHDVQDVLEIAGYDTEALEEWHQSIYGETENETHRDGHHA